MEKEHKADELGLDWVYCADNYKDAAVDIYNLRNKVKELQGGIDLASEALEYAYSMLRLDQTEIKDKVKKTLIQMRFAK